MMWPWYVGLILIIIFYCISIWLHELGHRKRSRMLGYKAKIVRNGLDIETHWWGKKHNQQDDISIIYWGIITGMAGLIIPIILIDYIGLLWVVWLLFAYGWGSKHDIKLLRELEEEIEEEYYEKHKHL